MKGWGFGMSLETRETKLFRRVIPGFCRDTPEEPEKFEKKLCVQFSFPIHFSFILVSNLSEEGLKHLHCISVSVWQIH